MRAPTLLFILTSCVVLLASSASALPIEMTFTGSLTAVPSPYDGLGLAPGDPIKGTIIYESDRPSFTDRGGDVSYRDPFLAAFIRVGHDDAYTLGDSDGCCDKITVGFDALSFFVDLTSGFDALASERLVLRIREDGADSTDRDRPLPTVLSSKGLEATAPFHGQIVGLANDAVTGRVDLDFTLTRVDIRPFEGDLDKTLGGGGPKTPPVPEPGTVLLLGLGLVGLAGRGKPRIAIA